MEKEYITFSMAMFIKDFGPMTKNKVMDNFVCKQATCIKEVGKMVKNTVLVNILLPMAITTKVNSIRE